MSERARHASRWRAPAIRTRRPSQFFINVADNKCLNFRSADPQGYGYTVFGKVVDGMDVVDKIAQGADRRRRPVSDGRAGRARRHQQARVVVDAAN